MIRVLLADDEPLTRAGIRAVLATDPEFEVVAEAAHGREAVQRTYLAAFFDLHLRGRPTTVFDRPVSPDVTLVG